MALKKGSYAGLFLLLLAALAGWSVGIDHRPSWKAGSSSIAADLSGKLSSAPSSTFSHRLFAHSSFSTAADQPRREEKRHKRSLPSQGILADFTFLQTPPPYCGLIHTLFLPKGCPQRVIANFSLRGPPSC